MKCMLRIIAASFCFCQAVSRTSLRHPGHATLGLLEHFTKNHTVLASESNATANMAVSAQMRASVDAWFAKVFAPKETTRECVKETSAMMEELRHAYTRRMVQGVLEEECGNFIYYERFGNDTEVCMAIVENLVRTGKSDKDYDTWCREVFAKRHRFEDAKDVPVKADPGPRRGKYADVKEFSYANDADPEDPCHGAVPCPSHAGEERAMVYDKQYTATKLDNGKAESNLEWTPHGNDVHATAQGGQSSAFGVSVGMPVLLCFLGVAAAFAL